MTVKSYAQRKLEKEAARINDKPLKPINYASEIKWGKIFTARLAGRDQAPAPDETASADASGDE